MTSRDSTQVRPAETDGWEQGKEKEKSSDIIKLAIKRMIPSGPLGKRQLSNCKIFAGENHDHEAQQPKKVDFNKFNFKNSKR